MIKSAGGLALGLAAAGYADVPRRRFALLGTGARARLYLDAVAGQFRDASELVALCDRNPGRLARTRGRLEHELIEQLGGAAESARIRVIPLRGAVREIEPWTASGSHGGGDEVMLNDLFGVPTTDPYQRRSDERGGAYSILIGAAANRCFETGCSVRIADLVSGLTLPATTPMPTRAMPVPMPRRVDL